MGELEDFVGCTIKRDLTKTTLNISQTDIINKKTQGFNEDVKSLMTFNNPATPHKDVVCNKYTDTSISYNLQKRYKSGVGLILYLLKHPRPELSNAIRELSKCMDKSNMNQYKTLLHAIKYMIDTKHYSYQVKPDRNLNGTWEIHVYSDTDKSGNNNS